MSFKDIALPLVRRGLYVLPNSSDGHKIPLIKNWPNDAACSVQQVEAWDKYFPADTNCGYITRGVCVLDDDIGDLKERIEKETGKKIPETFTVVTSVKKSGQHGMHYIFLESTAVLLCGKRSKEGEFDFKAGHGHQVMAPGSRHYSGAIYTPVDPEAKIAEMPAWLLEWIEKNTAPEASESLDTKREPVRDDFDIEDWIQHYELSGTWENDAKFHLDTCPFAGRYHTKDGKGRDPRASSILFDDGRLGWSCLATSCEGHAAGIGGLIKKLNEDHDPYPPIWPADDRLSDSEIQEEFDAMLNESPFKEEPRKMPVPATSGQVCTNVDCEEYREDACKICRPCANPRELEARAAAPVAAREEPPEDPEDKSFDLILAKTKTGSSGLRVLRVSDSPDRPIDWLWPNRIPAGNAFTMSGPIGCNKSMALLDMAARITKGDDWPDGEKNEYGAREVLICATEDDLETVIRPRLRAARADLTKCIYTVNAFDIGADGKRKSRQMDLEKDTLQLYRALREHPEILLVILDPVTGFYGNADPNDNRQIRKMITRLAQVCMQTGTAIACIVHENKKSDVNMVDKMMGASSLSQVIRAGMRFSFDAEKRPTGRIMASLKNSYGSRGGGMKFEVDEMDLVSTGGKPLKNIAYIRWTDTHDQTADEVSNAGKKMEEEGGADTKIDQAIKIYQDELRDGRRLHKDIHPILDKGGIGDETKRRARRKLGIVSSKQYPWYWWLPGKEYEPGSREREKREAEVI